MRWAMSSVSLLWHTSSPPASRQVRLADFQRSPAALYSTVTTDGDQPMAHATSDASLGPER